MKPNIKRLVDYQNDKNIINGIREIINPSYKNAGSHIEHDIQICNELYYIESEEGMILAFFMVGYHLIEMLDCCYLGLSTCRHEYKNSGFAKALFLEFARDCISRELDINKRITCYWTTATPIVYYWFTKYFKDVQPNREGDCTNEGKEVISKIALKKYPEATYNLDTPFVLRKAAKQINYSDIEQARLKRAVFDLNLKVFERYQLDETNGDRFLMFGFTPTHDKLIELTKN